MFSGSPHVYDDRGKISCGVTTDRDGILLTDLRDGRTYSGDSLLRKASLHWVGDRQGNVLVSYPDYYGETLLDYDPVNGMYRYGDNAGQITLTLSAKLQTAALEAMGDRVGTLAIYNYQTGQILCAVTTPTFDPEEPPVISADDPGEYTGVYMNRFLQSTYIPGSIFKIVTLAAALEEIPNITDKVFKCDGTYLLPGGDVTCMRAHGYQTLQEAFRNSCNCSFAQITEMLGSEKLSEYVDKFGVTESVRFDGYTTALGHFDLTGASMEQVAWSGIGQYKDTINPCAFLTFLGAIANGGSGAMPYVVESVQVGERTAYQAETTKTAALMSDRTAQILAAYMGLNVTEKYGAENFVGFTVCAKSGTGEVGGGKSPNAMFAGFLTDSQYPLAFIVAIEEGGFGAETCIPILSKVLQNIKVQG